MARMMRWALAGLAGAALLAACGSSGGGGGGMQGGGPPGFYIVISNFAFSPVQLSVPPGATVTVVNQDAMNHSVTSEAAMGDFTPGMMDGVSFDTGPFMGQKTFVVSATATTGTVVNYYCSVHKGAMPQASIKIDPAAQPGPAP